MALEAYAEPWRWLSLSERVTRDFVYANDEFDIRLPVDVQKAYARAFETGLFTRFDVCDWLETEEDRVVAARGFLFGVSDFRLGPCTFYVAQWDC